MFDFSFGELAVIGAVALVVLGPERLPRVARSVGEWAGKAQRYVAQVKADINREMELAELKKLQEQARGIAHEFETSVKNEVKGIESSVTSGLPGASSGVDLSTLGADDSSASWGDRDGWTPTRFNRRYKPGPSIDELSEEIAKLKRQLSLPAGAPGGRHKYSPRARINRTRIRR
jgi:sec-independent protein translocase protein TatB